MGWIATTNNPAVSSTIYNPTANLDVNPANETEVTLKAKWKYTKGIHSIANMQQMTAKVCKESTTPNRTATALDTDGSHAGDPNYVPTVTLADTRDNNTYTVSKLADGKCWMTQNLRIIDKTITPADSNVTTNYTIPASFVSGFDSYDTSYAYIDNAYGSYYSWYAATAGTGTRSLSTNGQNTTVSICPKGWRLPTGGNNGEFQTLYNNYNSSSALASSPVNLTLAGNLNSGSRFFQGIYGYYWSSTVDSGNYAYYLNLTTSDAYPANINNKHYGYSVRCVADDKLTFDDIANMQDMTPEICAKAQTHQTTTLRDIRDGNTYTVAKLKDGKCWMTQNLRIINKTLTPADSDVVSNYTIPASSVSGFYTNNISNAYVNAEGGFYTWYVAIASTSSGYSICPKGWRLPYGSYGGEFHALSNSYGGYLSALTSNPVNLTLSGFVLDSSYSFYGQNGYYWASNSNNSDTAYSMQLVIGGNVRPDMFSSKYAGFSVRCIAR